LAAAMYRTKTSTAVHEMRYWRPRDLNENGSDI
jgi:hypothetical protein